MLKAPGTSATAAAAYASATSRACTAWIRSPRGSGRYGGYGTATDDPDRYDDLDTDALPPYHGGDYDADDDYDAESYDEYLNEARLDRRWMWIAGVAGAIAMSPDAARAAQLLRIENGRLSDPTGALRYPPRRPA
mgnify:CR=1 FL=1